MVFTWQSKSISRDKMKLGWLIVGVLITVGLFLFYPGLFNMLVSWVQSAFNWVMGFVGSQSTTNLTGG